MHTGNRFNHIHPVISSRFVNYSQLPVTKKNTFKIFYKSRIIIPSTTCKVICLAGSNISTTFKCVIRLQRVKALLILTFAVLRAPLNPCMIAYLNNRHMCACVHVWIRVCVCMYMCVYVCATIYTLIIWRRHQYWRFRPEAQELQRLTAKIAYLQNWSYSLRNILSCAMIF